MASIRLIRGRIKSVQNIAQITRAMEMVAASKMKKAQEQAVLGKPYAQKIYEITRELAKKTDKQMHPLLSLGNSDGNTLIIIVSTNKGLCGGLNTNLFREIINWQLPNEKTEFITIGKKGSSFVVNTDRKLIADYSDNIPFISGVPAVIDVAVKGFIEGKYKEVYIVYNAFLNAMKQIPLKKIILPIYGVETGIDEHDQTFGEFLLEPSVDDILDSLLPHYLENQMRSSIYEAEASEQSARMLAMKQATDAADDFTKELTLIYNKARQEKITYEIADIVTARMVVE